MKTIKNNPIFSYIDNDFENWNVVDKYPHVEKREIKINTLEKDSTFTQIFTDPENQWVTQEELIDICTNRKDELNKNGYSNFFLLKSENEFFVACVDFDVVGRLGVFVHGLSRGYVWYASFPPRFVLPATKPVILGSEPQTLKPSDTLSIESAVNFLVEKGYKVTHIE